MKWTHRRKAHEGEPRKDREDQESERERARGWQPEMRPVVRTVRKVQVLCLVQQAGLWYEFEGRQVDGLGVQPRRVVGTMA